MKWPIRNRPEPGPFRRRLDEGGFTLVEVLVALGVAGGTLILVLSANNASLKQSLQAREELRLERAAASKLEEILLGGEQLSHGDLPGLPAWRWEAIRAVTLVGEMKKLRRVTLIVYRPDGTRALERSALVHLAERKP